MVRIDELFTVEYGNKLDMNKMNLDNTINGVAFVSRKKGNQGVSGYVRPIKNVTPYQANTITVALGGSYLLSSFVQQQEYYTAQNVAVLTPIDEKMPLLHRLYYARCIRHNRFRYSAFGREANRTLGSILLPSTPPTWVNTSEIPTLEGLSQVAGIKEDLSNPNLWKKFKLNSLFRISKGKRLTKASRHPGNVRFIGATEKNNGVTDLNDLTPTFEGGQLTVAYNGSVGWCFYQDKPFFACDDINVLEPKYTMNKWILLFIATVIKHEKSRYTYGYKWTKERMLQTEIRLPIDQEKKPNFSYMEKYMKGLPFSAAISEDSF